MAQPTARIEPTLRRVFGLSKLRTGQRQVIERVLAGADTLAVMPTGAGKSLCYQLPALLLEGRTIVISPLVALMKDQCDRLNALGVAAVQLNSALDAATRREADAALDQGRARIVFVTPEQLVDRGVLARLAAERCALLVVDEAHCISHWGHDFRPAFLEIGAARQALGKPPVLALTASANDSVADDIAEQLGIPRRGIVNTGHYRANLHYAVEVVAREDDKLAHVLARVQAEAGPTIVYTATVKAALAVYAALQGAGVAAGLYHGRLAAKARHAAQEAFMSGETRVMVATNAFGLGIDKADIRAVLHYQMPSNLDAYYQESGRAGRDGETAHCTLLFLQGDRAVQQFFLVNRYPARADVEALYRGLHQAPPEPAGWTPDTLQAALDLPRSKLRVALSLLRRQRIARLDRHGIVTLQRSGLSAAALDALAAAYQDKRAEDRALLEEMVAYAQSGACRWKLLLEHFDARPEGFERCMHCDNCRRIAAAEQAARQQPAAGGPPAPPEPQSAIFVPGQAVRVRRYGRGTVAAASAHTVDVEFGNGVRRSFLPDYVRAT